MLRSLSLLGCAGLVFIVACDSDVVVDGDGSGGDGGEGGQPSCMDFAGCEPECPGSEPHAGTSCDLPDTQECSYPSEDGSDCVRTYKCLFVDPEDGAPSEWTRTDEYDPLCYYDCGPGFCDPGDEAVESCPEGTRCYEMSYFDDPCGEIYLCADTAEPANECMWDPRLDDDCVYDGAMCLVETDGGCFVDYECAGGSWVAVGEACPE